MVYQGLYFHLLQLFMGTEKHLNAEKSPLLERSNPYGETKAINEKNFN